MHEALVSQHFIDLNPSGTIIPRTFSILQHEVNDLTMVFRGKPSKACERCRTRRLRCDLRKGACGQCIRADVVCSGYRDTKQLRIQDESQSIARRASRQVPSSSPQSLPLSVDVLARDAFFVYYATGTSKCWKYLKQYYHPTDTPDHLTVAIESLSLAYFWHLFYSDTALATARERYVLALRMTNNALKSPNAVGTDTTLLSSLLLDLFEKITATKPRSSSWTSHVDGALALVKLRGMEQFRKPSEFHVLVQLVNHYIASCVTNAQIVPIELLAVRDYVANNLNYEEHTLHVSELTVEFAKLRNGYRMGSFSNDEYFRASKGLDLKLEALDLTMPVAWRYSRNLVDEGSERMFDLHFDTYPHRNICYARNFIRVGRILLNEALIEGYLASPEGEKYWTLMERAYENIDTMVGEICASLPQYSDCDGPARHHLPALERSEPGPSLKELGHTHTLHHQAECYSLIWPLYAAGRSKAGPDVRPWVIKQLHYIGSHFCIRNAKIVAQILEEEKDVCTWDIYAMLGSYSFNA